MDPIEEQLYAIAGQEVASRNMSPGLMAKALVDANGDERKAAATYIKLRVEQLRAERKTHAASERARQDREREEAERARASVPESDGYVRGSGCVVLLLSVIAAACVLLTIVS